MGTSSSFLSVFQSLDISLDVVELNLSEKGLQGLIPEQIGDLTQLKLLDLHFNQLYGRIPSAISRLTALQHLELYGNGLNGYLPVELFQLTELVGINLSFNQFEGPIPPEIWNLKKLECLYLNNNNFSGEIPDSLFQLCLLGALKVCKLSANVNLAGYVPDIIWNIPSLNLSIDSTKVKIGTVISINIPQFPFHLVPRQSLLCMERLIPHEEAGVRCSSWREDSTRSWRHNGIVEVLNPLGTQTFQVWVGLAVTEEEMSVAREDVVFISHRWLSKSHPDDFDNSKLGHLKRLAEAHPEWKYFWIDYLCVPQKNLQFQTAAINSLPHYVKCCGTMVTLCGLEGEAALEVYKSRGWCRLEQISSTVPITNPEGGLFETQLFIANKDTDSFEKMAELSPAELNPLLGDFYDDDFDKPPEEKDRGRITKCLSVLCDGLLKGEELQKILATSILNSPCYLFNCPQGHGLKEIITHRTEELLCSKCLLPIVTVSPIFGCNKSICNFCICWSCIDEANQANLASKIN